MNNTYTIFAMYAFYVLSTCAHAIPFSSTLLCKTNDPMQCAVKLARDAVSMTGAGLAMTLCESDPTQCKVGMLGDAAVVVGGTAASHFGATAAIGGFLGMGAAATSPFGGPVIIGGAVTAVAGTFVLTNFAAKTAYCETHCTPALGLESGPLFQDLIKSNPNASLTELIAITKGAVNIDNLETQQKLVNAAWCVKYCPAATNQRFMCKMLENMSYKNQADKDAIVTYGKFLASTGTIGGFHRYLGPDQVEQSKLGKFIKKNGNEPEFCYKYLDVSLDFEIKQKKIKRFASMYGILKNIYLTFVDIKNDPFMLCTLHGFMKNGYTNDQLFTANPVQNDSHIESYLALREENDPELMALITSKSMFETEQTFCRRLRAYVTS